MTRVLRCGWLLGRLMLGLACSTEQPTAPSAVPVPPTITQPPQPLPRPLPSGEPVSTYVFSGPLDYAISGSTSGSQYLLYDNGVFGLDMTCSPTCTWARIDRTTTPSPSGSMTRELGTQRWSCLSDSRPTRGLCPFATGTLKGDLLEVRYGDSMQHSDFENAVHRNPNSN